MRTSVILATLCFFLVTLHTSSIRAEETWKKVEVGPDKGSYKGKLWGLDALARFENDQKFVTFTFNQQYSSVKAPQSRPVADKDAVVAKGCQRAVLLLDYVNKFVDMADFILISCFAIRETESNREGKGVVHQATFFCCVRIEIYDIESGFIDRTDAPGV